MGVLQSAVGCGIESQIWLLGRRWDAVIGTPCAHRRAMLYFADSGMTWKSLHGKYCKDAEQRGVRVLSYERWVQYAKFYSPHLRCGRPQADLCNACTRMDIQLADPTISDTMKAALRQVKALHLDEARAQRRAMNEAVKLHAAAWAPADPPLLLPACDEELELEPPQDVCEGGPPRKLLVMAEDFGAGIPMPFFGCKRPNADYYLSNLTVHMFNACDLTSKRNSVFLYDERTAGKGGDHLCSIRWALYTTQLKAQHAAAVPPHDGLLRVTDNCVAQNKSAQCFMFDSFLELVLGLTVGCHFLIAGHSHMKPDSTTSHVKATMRGRNVYTADDLIPLFKQVKGVVPELLGRESFWVWKPFLDKHFARPPAGFTQYHCYEISGGKLRGKNTVDSPDWDLVHTMYAADVRETLRAAVLKDVFGLMPTATPMDVVSATPRLPAALPQTLGFWCWRHSVMCVLIGCAFSDIAMTPNLEPPFHRRSWRASLKNCLSFHCNTTTSMLRWPQALRYTAQTSLLVSLHRG